MFKALKKLKQIFAECGIRNTECGIRDTRYGFLLFEIMVAVTILSIGLTLILRSFTTTIDAVRVSQDHTRAILLLEQKVFELERVGFAAPGTSSGKFKGALQMFEWELESTELEEVPLNQVTMSVKWQTTRRPQKVSVVTFLPSKEEE